MGRMQPQGHAGDARARGAVSVPWETQAGQLGSPGRKGREKTSGNCRHGHSVQTLGRLRRSGSAVVYSFWGKMALMFSVCSLAAGETLPRPCSGLLRFSPSRGVPPETRSKWADSGRLREGMRRRVPSKAHVLKS